MNPTCLLDLPPELLGLICAGLRLNGLRNTRLACKALANIGAEHLLPYVVVLFTGESLATLQEISEHPLLRLHVKKLIYEGKRLDDFKKKSEWEDYVVSRTWLSEEVDLDVLQRPPQPWTKEELHEGWKYYRNMRREQEEIVKNNSDKRQIGQAILRFPKLEAIEVLLSENTAFALSSRYFRKTFGPGLVEPLREYWYEKFDPPGMRQFFTCLVPLFTEMERIAGVNRSSKSALPSSDLKTPVFSVPNLKSLTAVSVSWMTITVWHSHFPAIYKALSELTELNLNFIVGDFDADGEEADPEVEGCAESLRKNDSLVKLIRSCPKLESLTIGFTTIDPSIGGQAADLKHVIGNHRLVHLRDVTFKKFLFNEDEMIAFFERHRSTLRKVELMDMCIDRDHYWDVLLQRTRELNIPWERFIIWGDIWIENDDLFYASTQENDCPVNPRIMMENYVMGKSDFNPFDREKGLHFDDEGEALWRTVDDWEWEDVVSEDGDNGDESNSDTDQVMQDAAI